MAEGTDRYVATRDTRPVVPRTPTLAVRTMRHIDCGLSGCLDPAPTPTWDDLGLDVPWRQVIEVLQPGSFPRPAQVIALRQHRILSSRRNLLVAAPTNAGKSLLGTLVLLEAIRRGQRAVLLEPLRAIAREKAEELERAAPALGVLLGRSLRIHLSTGDYRLEEETFHAPPPEHGEFVIATPERFEAILRNPSHDSWLASIGAVCVDEAHLLGSSHRGATLESV